MFIKDDIIRLKMDTFAYNKGLLCKVIEAEPFNNARVEIMGGTIYNDIGCTKYANLKIFELVRRGKDGMYI